jgi:hypothetical protein
MTAYQPEQWHDLFVATAGAAAALLVRRLRIPRSADEPLSWTAVPIGVIGAGTLPMVAAGISLIAAGGGGLYWLVPGSCWGSRGRCSTRGSCWSRSIADCRGSWGA